MTRTTSRHVQALLIGLAVLATTPTHAQEPLAGSQEAVAAELAKDIAGVLSEEGDNRIRMGPFDAPGSSTGIQAAIKAAIIKQTVASPTGDEINVKVEPNAPFSLSAEISLDEESNDVTVEAKLKDSTRRTKGRWIKYITQVADAAKVVSTTTEFPTKAEPGNTLLETKKGALEDAVINPSFTTPPGSNSQVTVKGGSPFRVEICVKQPDGSYLPVPVVDDGGLAVVDLKETQRYGIKIYNDSGHPVAANINIDGVNLFHFSEVGSYRKLGKLVVKPPKRGAPVAHLVKGWHFNNGRGGSKEFLITELGQSAALLTSKKVDESRVGTITVLFSFCMMVGDSEFGDFPADEPALSRRGPGQLGTGMGDATGNAVRDAALPVKFGTERASISIRYLKPKFDPALPQG